MWLLPLVLVTHIALAVALLVPSVLYAANLVAAFFVQRPSLRRLLGLRADASDAERARWREQAKRQRYVSHAMATAVDVIAFS